LESRRADECDRCRETPDRFVRREVAAPFNVCEERTLRRVLHAFDKEHQRGLAHVSITGDRRDVLRHARAEHERLRQFAARDALRRTEFISRRRHHERAYVLIDDIALRGAQPVEVFERRIFRPRDFEHS
jgi:hypothetical protein